jgi:hypothetical protein
MPNFEFKVNKEGRVVVYMDGVALKGVLDAKVNINGATQMANVTIKFSAPMQKFNQLKMGE